MIKKGNTDGIDESIDGKGIEADANNQNCVANGHKILQIFIVT